MMEHTHIDDAYEAYFGVNGDGPAPELDVRRTFSEMSSNAFEFVPTLGMRKFLPVHPASIAEIKLQAEKSPAFRTYLMSIWDPRWDVSQLLPMTQLFHNDQSAGNSVNILSDMVGAHGRIFNPQNNYGPVFREKPIVLLHQKEQMRVPKSPQLVRALVATSVKYGFAMLDQNGDEIIEDQVVGSERMVFEQNGKFNTSMAFETAFDAGLVNVSTDHIKQHYKGVGEILQFEMLETILSTLGLLSSVDLRLKEYAQSFYTKNKNVLFGSSPHRFDALVDQLMFDLIDMHGDEIFMEAIRSAMQIFTDRRDGFNNGLMHSKELVQTRTGEIKTLRSMESGAVDDAHEYVLEQQKRVLDAQVQTAVVNWFPNSRLVREVNPASVSRSLVMGYEDEESGTALIGMGKERAKQVVGLIARIASKADGEELESICDDLTCALIRLNELLPEIRSLNSGASSETTEALALLQAFKDAEANLAGLVSLVKNEWPSSSKNKIGQSVAEIIETVAAKLA